MAQLAKIDKALKYLEANQRNGKQPGNAFRLLQQAGLNQAIKRKAAFQRTRLFGGVSAYSGAARAEIEIIIRFFVADDFY